MPTPKLPIGCGLHRARRNRSRGLRVKQAGTALPQRPVPTASLPPPTSHLRDSSQ